MTTIVDLDTGQVLGIVDGRDHKGVGDWLFARPLKWRLAVEVVATDPQATSARQNHSQRVKGRRGRAVDKAWAHRMLLLRGGHTLSCRAALQLEEVFTLDHSTGTLHAVWKVKERLRALLRTCSLEDAAVAKMVLEDLVKAAARPKTNRLFTAPCADGGKRSRCW